jgi:hypothetical protein
MYTGIKFRRIPFHSHLLPFPVLNFSVHEFTNYISPQYKKNTKIKYVVTCSVIKAKRTGMS